jgi:hypothetical protein
MGSRPRKVDGLVQVVVPCLRCGTDVPANIAPDFKGTLRKLCHTCKKQGPTVFEGEHSDGCKHVSKGGGKS